MKFEDWYSINPFKDMLDTKRLTLKEKKIMTPVVVNSSFVIEARKYYAEYARLKKRYIIPEFIRTEFPIYYKKRFMSIMCYYHLERDINFLIKYIPEAINLLEFIKSNEKTSELLKEEMKLFHVPYARGYNEYVKIDHEGKLLGWKFKIE